MYLICRSGVCNRCIVISPTPCGIFEIYLWNLENFVYFENSGTSFENQKTTKKMECDKKIRGAPIGNLKKVGMCWKNWILQNSFEIMGHKNSVFLKFPFGNLQKSWNVLKRLGFGNLKKVGICWNKLGTPYGNCRLFKNKNMNKLFIAMFTLEISVIFLIIKNISDSRRFLKYW